MEFSLAKLAWFIKPPGYSLLKIGEPGLGYSNPQKNPIITSEDHGCCGVHLLMLALSSLLYWRDNTQKKRVRAFHIMVRAHASTDLSSSVRGPSTASPVFSPSQGLLTEPSKTSFQIHLFSKAPQNEREEKKTNNRRSASKQGQENGCI